jgi:hypothetical protein
VVVSTIETLNDYALELLDATEAALDTTPSGAPDRAYVAPATPALDCCPELAVYVTQLSYDALSPSAPPGIDRKRSKLGALILASMTARFVRCVPTLTDPEAEPPSAAALTAAAAEVLRDGWAVWNVVTHRIAAGTLFDGCVGVYIDPLEPVDDQGMCAGWLLNLRVGIQGYSTET